VGRNEGKKKKGRESRKWTICASLNFS